MYTRGSRDAEHTIAVALHGIEPATFERCALIRDWLEDHGVDRVTLLAIPARDLHPLGERSPAMADWLIERQRAGDAIAQHGFQHVAFNRRTRLLAARSGGRVGEFVGLDSEETRRAVHAGWRILKLAGIEPEGFVAPSYAYTSALREILRMRFHWWAELTRVYCTQPAVGTQGHEHFAPAWSLASAGLLPRAVSAPLVRIGSMLPTQTLRIDVHPADLRHPRHMLALEWVLARAARRRTAITYQELAERQRRVDSQQPLAGKLAEI